MFSIEYCCFANFDGDSLDTEAINRADDHIGEVLSIIVATVPKLSPSGPLTH
jgi:hypothetical protein